jgi:hypothetical protein
MIYYYYYYYIQAPGILQESFAQITPGAGNDKDDYWDGEDTVMQAHKHLSETPEGTDVFDVYDNSTGHNCMPPDGLNISKVNKGPGRARKEDCNIRNGWYESGDDERHVQSLQFRVGDELHATIKTNAKLTRDKVASYDYYAGHVIAEGSELVGVQKGSTQILQERGVAFEKCGCKKDKERTAINKHKKDVTTAFEANKDNPARFHDFLGLPSKQEVGAHVATIRCTCSQCVLAQQPDFVSQQSALEELYTSFNAEHGTFHMCHFLPNFHPELNPIERVWGRMKWYVRRFSDGKLSTLKRLQREGLANTNLPMAMIRRFC